MASPRPRGHRTFSSPFGRFYSGKVDVGRPGDGPALAIWTGGTNTPSRAVVKLRLSFLSAEAWKLCAT
ncbi:hypothetical protein OPV22_025186 [Ensete ventricosum]|uniref:Uncharacterized protein n=1 Tax=Ensete ventricosum TaxID=4639 RepID=A0AAV8QIV8_ENSVE|nr:hypothetical protein OPV22_025186 [Ensete ventricosum]